MVDRDVVGQPRPGQAVGDGSPGITERRLEERPGFIRRGERPPAVKDADLEPVAEERSITSRPRPVLRLRSTDLRYIVAPIVVHREQTAAGAEDSRSLGDLVGDGAAERRPQADDDISRRIRRGERRRTTRVDDGDAGAECFELPSAKTLGCIDDDDVSSLHRTQRLDRPRDLALDIEDPGQLFVEPGPQFEGEISHWRRV